MDYKLNYISTLVAQQINQVLQSKGIPSEDRVLILSPNNEAVTKSGIIIPDNVKEGVPRKGVLIQMGNITEAYESYKKMEIGTILTYGMYAGKEIHFDSEIFSEGIQELLKKNTFTVLSINEIIYLETNSI